MPEKIVPAGGGTGRWHSYDVGNGLGDGEVRAICQDQGGYIWFATRNGGVSRFDGRRFVTFGREDGLADRTVLSMIQDQAGYFWFGTLKGVSRYAPWESADRAWRTFTTQDGLAHDVVRAIFQDRDGCLWFGTQGNGVSRFDGERFTTFNKTNGLAANYVATIYQDRAGYLYFGTGTEYSLFDVNIFHGNGVSRFDGRVWTTLTIADGLAGNDVKAILQDRKGHVWFGTNNGISRFDGQTWHTVTMPGGLLHHGVFAAYEDMEGHLWFGIVQGGAICYDDNTFTHFTTEHGLLHNWVHAIFQDREGHLWLGNSGGVSRYDGQVWRTFTTEDGMVSNDGIAVFQDREGIVWFKTHRGLVRYRDRAFQIFLKEEDLPLSGGTGVFQQRDGTIWICAGNKGALRYDGHIFSVFTTEDGLADGCFAVFEDREKNLWFGTSSGVSRYDGRVFQTLTPEDGLAGNLVRSIFEDRDGQIWFSTSSGFTRFRQPEPIPPLVFIDAVVADRRYEQVSELELSSAVGLTAFEFHAMSLKTRPEAMVYRYRLKGFEEAWRNTRTRRVEYENLPMGEYVFEVVAVDRDLVYSEVPATVQLHVVRDPRDEQIDELERRVRERTRALEVEAALERLRSRSLAMQGTHELPDVAAVLMDELGRLGFQPWTLSILLAGENRTQARVVAAAKGLAKESVASLDDPRIPPELGAGEKVAQARAAGERSYYVRLEGELLSNFVEVIHDALGGEFETSNHPEPLHIYYAFFRQGDLHFYL